MIIKGKRGDDLFPRKKILFWEYYSIQYTLLTQTSDLKKKKDILLSVVSATAYGAGGLSKIVSNKE